MAIFSWIQWENILSFFSLNWTTEKTDWIDWVKFCDCVYAHDSVCALESWVIIKTTTNVNRSKHRRLPIWLMQRAARSFIHVRRFSYSLITCFQTFFFCNDRNQTNYMAFFSVFEFVTELCAWDFLHGKKVRDVKQIDDSESIDG